MKSLFFMLEVFHEFKIIYKQLQLRVKYFPLTGCRLKQGFPNFSARDPQNNGARDWAPPINPGGAI